MHASVSLRGSGLGLAFSTDLSVTACHTLHVCTYIPAVFPEGFGSLLYVQVLLDLLNF